MALKAPPRASVLPARATYSSRRCFSEQGISFGWEGEINTNEVKLQRQGKSDPYQAQIPFDGGGHCQWRSIEVTLAAKYWRGGQLDLAGRMSSGELEARFIVD